MVKHLLWLVLESNPQGQAPKLLPMQTEVSVKRGMHNTIGSDGSGVWLTQDSMVI